MSRFIELYRRLGFSLVALRPKSKTPLVKWEEFQDRMATPEEIDTWFGQHEGSTPNVGIVTGKISDLIVLDVDGPNGEASLGFVGDIPNTPTVRTGRGRHFYFRHPGYELGNRAGFLPGLDLRGDGGYVVAPPSVHPDGSTYEWEVSPDEMPMAEMPHWLLELVVSKPKANTIAKHVQPVSSGASRSAKAEVDRILGELSQAEEGTRNDALNRAAFSLGQIVGAGNLESAWAFDQLARMGLQIGLDEKEAIATVESGLSAGLREPRESAGEVWEILEDTPDTMDRPIRLIDGRGYGATWLPVGQRNSDPGKPQTELVVFDGEGTFYTEREIPDSRAMDELPFVVDLPHRPMGQKLLSPVGFNRLRRQELPEPADVFGRICDGIDAFVSFENSLADQRAMCEFVACWAMATYAIDAFDVVGYLWPTGERGSGKTVLLNTVSSLAFLGRTMTAGGSFASIRDEAHYGATIAFDDFENALKMDQEKRELLLAGNTRGAVISLKELVGEKWETRYVNNFAPRLFSSIGTPDPVLGSRTISIPLITTTDHVKTRRSPSRVEHWPHDLRTLIDDLWLTGVVHLGRIRECDAEASQVSELHARSHDIWRTSLAIAYWLQVDHGVARLFDRVTAISVAYQQQVQEVQGMDLIGLVLNALHGQLSDTGLPSLILPTADILHSVREHARSTDQESEEVHTLDAQRIGSLLSRLGFPKAPSHGRKRSWMIGMDRVAEVANRRSHILPKIEGVPVVDEPSVEAEEMVKRAVNPRFLDVLTDVDA